MTAQKKISGTTPSGLQKRPVITRQSGKDGEAGVDLVADEVPVAVSYNGVTHAVMMASPIDLEDFAIGFSLTEGIVDSAADIRSTEVVEAQQGVALQITIAKQLANRVADRQRSLSGRAGCGICGLTDIAAAVPNLKPLTSTPPPAHTAVHQAAQTLQSKQALQQACGGIHGAALCDASGRVKLVREDVGRHNALDKLIGAAYQANRELAFAKDDFVLLSSRASHELVNKCVMVGVHSLVTISAASSLAIDIANKSNLNLIGFVRGDRQLVYTSP